MINNIDENIFKTAINEFNKEKEILLEVEFEQKEIIVNGFRFDKLVKFRYQKKELKYYVEIKANINNTVLALLKYHKEALPYPLLLITEYINNNKAEELKQNGIQFIDTAGNAYINYFPIYIYIKGNKPYNKFFKKKNYRFFEPSGLKVIYALLTDTELVRKPYRMIAEIANVALGTVGWTMNDLIKLGFIMDMGEKGRKLLNNEELLNRWCTDYNEKLKPKLLINKFAGPENWWINYKLDPEYAQWGGEVAANKLIKYLKPQDIIIYVNRENYQKIIIENRLRKDMDGNTVFYERFWKMDMNTELKELVHPILIYADLINTNNQRVLEMAKVIYEEYINRYIRKN